MKAGLLLLLSFWYVSVNATVRVASPFGDHMVLQREKPVPVWGSAEAGEKVSVRFGNQTANTQADESGAWRVELLAMKASSNGRKLIVEGSASDAAIEFRDVLVGEVWLCGGQSNMERQLGPRGGQKDIVGWKEEAAKANFPLIRELKVEQSRDLLPQDSVSTKWRVCSPETVVDFTAVGYFFARDIYEALEVPIGIIHSSWGGTPAEAWTSFEGLAEFPRHVKQAELLHELAGDPEAGKMKYQQQLDRWFAENDPSSPEEMRASDSEDWESMSLPTLWEDAGHPGVDGICWFRKTVTLPESFVGEALLLELGAIDDLDTTWVNGSLVGSTNGWQTPREYSIDSSLTANGELSILVRVLDTGGGGGIWNPEQPLRLSVKGSEIEVLDLVGEWEFQFSSKFGKGVWPPQDLSQSPGAPTVLYNAMIAPLVPYALRGFTFYQGEANAGNPVEYRRLLPALINDWRAKWGDDSLPFLFVQIAPFEGMPPEIREAQRLAEKESATTAMVVTIDVGDAEDIHPAAKEPVGERLALAARALAYGEEIVYSGPKFENWSASAEKARVTFARSRSNLVAVGGELTGFEIAGSNGVFHEANARIEGDTVVLSHRAVKEPQSVRYGWANVAEGNLFNSAGLPASPFTSDELE